MRASPWMLVLVLLLPGRALAQDGDPVIDVAADPRLDPVPEALASAVTELRATARRMNRCRYGWARTISMYPDECYEWLAALEAAPVEVRTHAVGLELVRSLMIRRGQRGAIRYYAMLWAELLGTGGVPAARYLIRALSLLDLDTPNHEQQARVAVVALEQITGQPITPIPPWERGAGEFNDFERPWRAWRPRAREAWLAWYRAHGEEPLEAWRRDGLAAHRANLESDDAVLRVLAVDALWHANAPDREAIARAQLASPVVFGEARRHLHSMVVNGWRVMDWREASRVTRDALRERARLRRSTR